MEGGVEYERVLQAEFVEANRKVTKNVKYNFFITFFAKTIEIKVLIW